MAHSSFGKDTLRNTGIGLSWPLSSTNISVVSSGVMNKYVSITSREHMNNMHTSDTTERVAKGKVNNPAMEVTK